MSYRINTNTASLSAQRHLDKAQRITTKSLQALASGSRVAEASNDAAGFAISESLRAQMSGLKQAKLNAESAVSFVQTAEGSLNEQNNILVRLRELSVQAASDTVGDMERGFLDKEFQALTSEFDRIAKSTRYGNKQLLIGNNQNFEFHVGASSGEESIIKFKLDANTTSDEVGIAGLDIEEQDSALDSLGALDSALNQVLQTRASFGAAQSRFNFAIDNLSSQHQNISEAKSIIADVDVASEVSELARGRILEDLSTSVLSQANLTSNRVSRLIG